MTATKEERSIDMAPRARGPVVVAIRCALVALALALGGPVSTTGRAQAPAPDATTSTSASTTSTTTPEAPEPPRLRLLGQTPWVSPGGDLTLVVSTTGIPDPGRVDVTVSLFPRVTNRADLGASFSGDGLRSALWQLPGGPVHLVDLPAAPDGSRTITVPTQSPTAAADRARARVQGGIYPVEVQLLDQATGDPIDRLITHLLSVEPPKDGTKLGVVFVLPVSAPPAVGPDGARTGPPEGAARVASIADGLSAVPHVPVTVMPTPETLDALAAGAPETARALSAAIGDRPVVARPYVPLRVPSLGVQAGPTLTAQLDAGTIATTNVLGRAPTATAWVADEPLDTAALGELSAIGVNHVVLPASSLAPPRPGRGERAPAVAPIPRQPVPVSAGDGRSVRALVADPALAAHTDPAMPAEAHALAAHHLLTELAGIVLLPPTRGATAPPAGELDQGVVTILPPRGWQASEAFLAELLAGVAQSPVLRGVEPGTAFALGQTTPVASTTSTTRSRRATTTTIPPDERTLEPLPTPDVRLGRALGGASSTLAVHTAVLPDAPKGAVPPAQQVLVAASADLTVDEQVHRLTAIDRALDADLRKIRIPEGRDLRLTSRTGELPISMINDAPAPARVLLRVSSEKLEVLGGTDRLITLDRQNTTEPIRVRARTAGAFPLRITLLSPDGGRELSQAEYRVRSNSLPGVGIAVSVAAGLVLAFWWGKTLLFSPRGAHLRR